MTRPHYFTQEQLDRIYAWRRANRSYAFIGRRVGCCWSTVRYQCVLAAVFPIGVAPRRSKHPMVSGRGGVTVRRFTPREDAILLSMHADRINHTEIGRALGRNSASVRNRILALAAYRLQELAS